MRQWFKIFLILFFFGLLVYANSLNNKFLWDDYFIVGHSDLSQTKFIFSQWNPVNNKYNAGYYRPLAHMVYAFCYGTFKTNYWQYHLLNLFLFVLLASLIYILIEKLTKNIPLAFLTAIFFLIHPINGIMVNNIVSCVLSIQLIFMFGAIIWLWESLERGNDRRLYFLSLLTSFLSLFWYDMGVLTPIYLSAVIFVFRKESINLKFNYLLPFFLISIAFFLFKHFFLKGSAFLTGITGFHMTGWEYWASLFKVISWYFAKLFFLKGIVMQWVTPIVHEYLFWNCVGAVCLPLIFILYFLKYREQKIIQLAVVWILIGVAPIGLVAFFNPQVGAILEPHWLIFSSIGLFIVTAFYCLAILNSNRQIGLALLLILIFSWGVSSRAYNLKWADEKSYALYWSHELPDYKFIDTVLGDVYQEEGDYKNSIKYYKLSNHGASINAVACNQIGLMDMKEGRVKEAEADFKLAILIDTHLSPAYNNLGVIFFNKSEWVKAKRFFTQALDNDPYLLQAREYLAKIALHDSNPQQAIQLCLKNLNIKDNDVGTIFLLIQIYVDQKNSKDLKTLVYRVFKEVNDPLVLTKLGEVMTLNNINDVAQECFVKVLRLKPNFALAYLDEGILFERQGKYDQAIETWKKGLSLYPSEQQFIKHISQAMELKNDNKKVNQ